MIVVWAFESDVLFASRNCQYYCCLSGIKLGDFHHTMANPRIICKKFYCAAKSLCILHGVLALNWVHTCMHPPFSSRRPSLISRLWSTAKDCHVSEVTRLFSETPEDPRLRLFPSRICCSVWSSHFGIDLFILTHMTRKYDTESHMYVCHLNYDVFIKTEFFWS